MKTTKLSEKLNNKQGASILVALMLFLVVTMTSILIFTAATANTGRLERQRASEAAIAYSNSVISVLNNQIMSTNMTVEYPIQDTYLKNNAKKLVEEPLTCISGTSIKESSKIPDTVFCADYINTAANEILKYSNNSTATAPPEYTITIPNTNSADVKSAFNGYSATIVLDGMDYTAGKKSFSINGSVKVMYKNTVVSTSNFKIPATVRGYSNRQIDWTNGKNETVSGAVVVKWGKIVTY